MKYDIHVSQKAIIDNNFDLDLVDGAIMEFCRDFSTTSVCRFLVEDGRRYYWLSHKLICEQLPILRLKPDTMYRRMKALSEKGFIAAHPNNRQMNASWYAILPLADLLTGSYGPKAQPSENNPMVPPAEPIGAKSEPPEQNPKGIPGATIGLESEPSEKNPMVEPDTIGELSEPSDENPKGIGSKSEGPSDQNPMYNNNTSYKGINNNSSTSSSTAADAAGTPTPIEPVIAEELNGAADEPKNPVDPNEAPGGARPGAKPKATTPAKPAVVNHFFGQSIIAEKVAFVEAFNSEEDYCIYDLPFYYEVVKNWALGKGIQKKDWIATARSFMLGDAKKGQARFRPDLQPQQSQANGYPAKSVRNATPGNQTQQQRADQARDVFSAIDAMVSAG